jgi:hypothetical protein
MQKRENELLGEGRYAQCKRLRGGLPAGGGIGALIH